MKITDADLNFSIMLNKIGAGSTIQSRNSETRRSRNLLATFNTTPLVSIRRTAWKNAIREMEWFLSGSSNIKDLHPKVHSWWKPWANENGDVFNNYSKQFRLQDGYMDQIGYMINTIKNDPSSRRNVITTWNTAEMVHPDTPITNCHGTVIQAFVDPDDSLHLTMYQRSCDMVVGVPHNWIQYWALLMYLAHKTNKSVGTFTWIGGDCHIYKNHYELAREIVNTGFRIPVRNLLDINLIYTPSSEDFLAEDFSLDSEYNPILKTSAKMVV